MAGPTSHDQLLAEPAAATCLIGKLMDDPDLFAQMLVGAELYDWCAFEATARWAFGSIRQAHPAIREAIREDERRCDSLWELCANADITGLWAHLDVHSRLTSVEGGGVLQESSYGNSLLHVVLVSRSSETKSKRLLAWLLSRPGAAKAANNGNIYRQTALHLCALHGKGAIARKIARLPGIHLDARDHYDVTPLVMAVREEQPDVVAALIEAGADPNAFVANCHGHGDTPLILAVRLKNSTIVKQLLEAPNIDLHQKTLIGVPFGKEAIDFAPAGSLLRMLLENRMTMIKVSKYSVDDTPYSVSSPASTSAPSSASFHDGDHSCYDALEFTPLPTLTDVDDDAAQGCSVVQEHIKSNALDETSCFCLVWAWLAHRVGSRA